MNEVKEEYEEENLREVNRHLMRVINSLGAWGEVWADCGNGHFYCDREPEECDHCKEMVETYQEALQGRYE